MSNSPNRANERELWSLALRGSRMGTWSRDVVTNEVTWSPELEEVFGVVPGTFAGTEGGFYEFVVPEDREPVARAVNAAVEGRTDYVVEFRYRHGSGQIRWMEGRGRATYNDDGTPRMLYGVGIDIEERKRAEQDVRRHQEENARLLDVAREALKRRDEFMSIASHELRTPLTSLLLQLEQLGRALERREAGAAGEEGDLRRRVDVGVRQVRRMAELVDRLLHGAAAERPLERTAVDLGALLRDVVERMGASAARASVTLSVDIDDATAPVVGSWDRSGLEQVVTNLVANAIKYGAGAPVHVRAIPGPANEVVIEVIDGGIGIRPEDRDRIFERFERAAEGFGGLGLGLAIVRSIVMRHSGEVSVDSAPGEGSTFRVRLPRA